VQSCHTRNAKQNPSPDCYNIASQFKENRSGTIAKGKTFGIPFRFYDRVYLPGNQIKAVDVERALPGPGTYNIRTKSTYLRQRNRYTLREKLDKEYRNDVPGSATYLPSMSTQYPGQFGKIRVGLGLGQRQDWTKGFTKTPGPGNYNLPSFVDKYMSKSQAFRKYHRKALKSKINRLRRRKRRKKKHKR